MNQIVPSAINPPLQSFSLSDGAVGQNLLGLLRSFEKNPGDLRLLEETVEILQTLISVTHRRGLLQGDESVAERVLASSSGSSQPGNQGSRKKRAAKRGRSADLATDDLILHSADPESKISGPALDGQLVVQALNRILSMVRSLNDEGGDRCDDMVLLVALAADLCTSICDSILSRRSADTCTVAEYEIIASSGKQILGNLEAWARNILGRIEEMEGGLRMPMLEQEEYVYALKALLCGCSAMVSLFGTKLSRSSKLLGSLRSLAWECLSVASEGVVQSAAKLVAVLPLAGGTDKTTPSDLWTQSLKDAVSCAHQTLLAAVPVNTMLGQPGQHQTTMSQNVKESMERHIEMMQRSTSEQARGESLVQRLSALTLVVSSLLGCDLQSLSSAANLLHASVDVESYLELAEAMLSVPLAAETCFHSTKKRLRSEPVDGGLLSLSVLVQKIANHVKLFGCELLKCLLASLGGPTLLPYARRILRISHAALLSSSSANVRKAVEPGSEIQFTGKRQRWLHSSLKVRSAAVEAFRITVLAFGSDPCAKASTARNTATTGYTGNVEKSINLVCGCLLEEITLQKSPQQESDTWGSPYERAELVSTAADCLASALASGGEFMPLSLRALVDSVALICLSTMSDGATGIGLTSFVEVKASFLNFACCCIETPWQDGAASSIGDALVLVAYSCQHDADPRVMQAATAAVRLCESLNCSRIPALAMVSRSNELIPGPADEMLKDLALVQAELDKQREVRRTEAAKAAAATSEQATAKAAPKPYPKKQRVQEKANDNVHMPPESEVVRVKPSPPASLFSEKTYLQPMERNAPALKETEQVDIPLDSKLPAKVGNRDDDSEEDELPMIVDCGPDQDDE